MVEPHAQSCPFCTVASTDMIASNTLAFALRDRFPVRALHTLVLPRRHVADLFETTAAEREAIHALVVTCRADIMAADSSVGGFNIGSNVGAVAGQKIFHAHVHVIPRRAGETPPPPARDEI